MKPYLTLMRRASDEYIVNKSRFIGTASPAKTPEEALAFIADIKQANPGANHNCYAYIIGQNSGIMRYSDDGEPGGTAGMPIIEVMKARKVVDCAVVVTRYFGGVLLGAGGLTRAYAHSCSIALSAAGIAAMHPTNRYICEAPYPLWDRARFFLAARPVRVIECEYGAAVGFTLLVREIDAEDVLAGLMTATDGRVETLFESASYMAWEEKDGSV